MWIDDCDAWVADGVKIPSRTDHLRRLRLEASPPLRLVRFECDSEDRGLAGISSSPEATELSKIASCGRRVPAGGTSGRRLSNRASAKEMRSLVGVAGVEGMTSPSSSSSTSGSSCLFVDERAEGTACELGGEERMACRSVNSVGVGEGGAGAGTDDAPAGFALVRVRSRFAGLCRRFETDGAAVPRGTSNLLPPIEGIGAEEAAAVALVRSSKAWLPLGAATGLIASSSLDAQSPLVSLASS